MARRIQISIDEVARAKQLRDQAATISEYRGDIRPPSLALSILLTAEQGLEADRVAKILGTSRRTVFRDRRYLRNQGGAPKNSWGGRRHCSMTIEEEQEFLSQWIDKATIGGVLTVLPIHEALVNRLGRNVPLSTTYRLRDIRPPSLARHNWRKVEPDEGGRMSPTKHPKSNPGLQDEFKKNSPKQWKPPV